MLELLEIVALAVFWICCGAFAFNIALHVLDYCFKTITFFITKIFIDKQVQYATFKTCWDDVKRNN